MVCVLEKGWEDGEGKIIGKGVGRVGVKQKGWEEWENGGSYEIMYGDIRDEKGYVGELMELGRGGYYGGKRKGESKVIKEVGWGSKEEDVRDLIVEFS